MAATQLFTKCGINIQWHTIQALKRTRYNTDDLENMLSETDQSQKGQILYDSTYMKFLESSHRDKSRMWLTQARGEGELLFKVLFRKMKKVLLMDGDDGIAQ